MVYICIIKYEIYYFSNLNKIRYISCYLLFYIQFFLIDVYWRVFDYVREIEDWVCFSNYVFFSSNRIGRINVDESVWVYNVKFKRLDS